MEWYNNSLFSCTEEGSSKIAAAPSPNSEALSGSLKFLPIEPLSDDIINIANRFSVCSIKRSEVNSSDEALISDVVIEVLSNLDEIFEIIILLLKFFLAHLYSLRQTF